MALDPSQDKCPVPIVKNTTFVSRIQVEKLFGLYDYDLVPRPGYEETSKLLILYGENGTGKTTLLWLIHHLLSKKGGGHKTFVARTKFKRFAVWLGSSTKVVAERDDSLDGSFRMSIQQGSETIEFFMRADESGSVTVSGEDESAAFDEFLTHLPDLNLPFLEDTRRMTPMEEGRERRSHAASSRFSRSTMEREVALFLDPEEARQQRARIPSAPELALRRLFSWVSAQALAGSTEGQLNVNVVYGEIIRRIGTPTREKSKEEVINPDELIQTLQAQSTRTKRFSQYGLTSDFTVDSFVQSIEDNRDSKQHLQIIAQILRPFIEANAARLDALDAIQTTIRTFVDSINSFYHNKRLVFHLRGGIKVFTPEGKRIPTYKLSSGEQELLLLFCDVLIARRASTIFIIDEPELSLNITWQRILIDALLTLAGGAPIQFLLATHSIELLAQRRNAVLRLKADGKDSDEDS